LLRIYAHARVNDLENDMVSVVEAGLELHKPLSGVLEPVRKQIDEDLSEPVLVRDESDSFKGWIDGGEDLDPFGLCLEIEDALTLLQQV